MLAPLCCNNIIAHGTQTKADLANQQNTSQSELDQVSLLTFRPQEGNRNVLNMLVRQMIHGFIGMTKSAEMTEICTDIQTINSLIVSKRHKDNFSCHDSHIQYMIDQEILDQDPQTDRRILPSPQKAQPSLQEEEVDENSSLGLPQNAASTNSISTTRKKRRRSKYFWCFSTKGECFLSLFLVILLLASTYFVYEYQIQEIENSKIVEILKQKHAVQSLQADKPNTILPPAISGYLNVLSKQHKSSQIQTAVMNTQADKIDNIIPIREEIAKKKEFFGKRTWMWVSQGESGQLRKRMREAVETQVNKKGYGFTIVNRSNWQNFLDNPQIQNIRKFNQSLKSIASKSNSTESESKFQKINEKAIMLEILRRNGGIMIDSNIVLTENIKWIDEIERNNHTNFGRSSMAKIIGFFSPEKSSPLTSTQMTSQRSKLMVKYPSISPYFLFAEPQSQFLADFLHVYTSLFTDLSSKDSSIKQYNITIANLQGKLSQDDLFYLASQITLRKREKMSKTKQFAIDYYGLVTINENYGPVKVSFVLKGQVEKIYRHICAITEVQLVQTMGKIHWLAVLDDIDTISSFFQKDLDDKRVLNGSFLHLNVMKKVANVSNVNNEIFTLEILGYPVQNAKWVNLPKRLYTYLPKQPQDSSLFTQIWVQHIKTQAFNSGFEFIIVTDSNYDRHVSQEQYSRINSILKDYKTFTYEDTKLELICLSILEEKGGIWIDPFTVLNENLNWATQLYKDFKIWNRFFRVPRVLMSFDPNLGSYNWTINIANNSTKMAWNISFDRSFIASNPRAELISSWLNNFIANLKSTEKQLNETMNKCQINPSWIAEKKHERLMMNSLLCAISSKEQELSKKEPKVQVVEHFRMWTLNGLMGLNKLSYFKLQEPNHQANTYLWKYPIPFVESTIGRIEYPFKLQPSDVKELQSIFLQNSANLTSVAHPKSLLMKYFGKIGTKTTKKGDKLQKYANYKRVMSLPKIVWIYFDGNQTDDNTLTFKCIDNIKYYGTNVSNYTVRLVNEVNYTEWLPEHQAKQTSHFLQKLTDRSKTQKSNLKDHLKGIKQKFILLKLLKLHGGIMINKRVLLMQNLSWLDDIFLNPFINKQSDVEPQVFGFYSPGYSTHMQFLNKNKRLVKYPTLQPFFLAAIKGAYFIEDIHAQLMTILNQPLKAKEKMLKSADQTRWLRGTDTYYESFYLACQFILRQKQKDLDKRGMKRQAIDHYGLYSINTRFYSFKLNRYFDGISSKTIKQHLGSYPLENLEDMTGPIRYIALLPKFQQISSMINNTLTTNKSTIMEGSFLHKYVFLDQKVNGLVVKHQLTPQKDKPQWSQLPSKVWVYEEKPSDSQKLPKKLMLAKLQLIAKQDNLDLQQISDNNIKDHLDSETYSRISKLINISGNDIFRFHLYNLALLLQHGGVIIPNSYLVLHSLTFIKKIASYSNEVLFNRNGNLPKVLLLVDTLNAPINEWTWTANGKTGHRLGFTSEFIASQKGSELIQDWLKQLQKMISLNGKELSDHFKSCGLQNQKDRWFKKDRSLLINDALVCVLAHKQRELKQKINVTEHYRLWGLSQQFCISKFENPLNLDGLSDNLNPFLWHYPLKDVEMVTGPIRHMVRLKDWMMNDLEKRLKDWDSSSWGHPQSFLSVHLQSPLRPYMKPNSWEIKLT